MYSYGSSIYFGDGSVATATAAVAAGDAVAKAAMVAPVSGGRWLKGKGLNFVLGLNKADLGGMCFYRSRVSQFFSIGGWYPMPFLRSSSQL